MPTLARLKEAGKMKAKKAKADSGGGDAERGNKAEPEPVPLPLAAATSCSSLTKGEESKSKSNDKKRKHPRRSSRERNIVIPFEQSQAATTVAKNVPKPAVSTSKSKHKKQKLASSTQAQAAAIAAKNVPKPAVSTHRGPRRGGTTKRVRHSKRVIHHEDDNIGQRKMPPELNVPAAAKGQKANQNDKKNPKAGDKIDENTAKEGTKLILKSNLQQTQPVAVARGSLSSSTYSLDCILAYDHGLSRHVIQGDWKGDDGGIGSRRFEWTRTTKDGYFNGSFNLDFRVVPESEVKLSFKPTGVGTFEVNGSGKNVIGVFELHGTATKHTKGSDPKYRISLRKRYVGPLCRAANKGKAGKSNDKKRKNPTKANQNDKKNQKAGDKIDKNTAKEAKKVTLKSNLQQTQPAVAVLRPANEMTDQEKKEKERFSMFVRVLMKYLKQRDANMHDQAKATIKECCEKNKSGDPNFRCLTSTMKARLHAIVGESYWKKAHDYLDHLLKQKREQKLRQQQGQQLGMPTAHPRTSLSHTGVPTPQLLMAQSQAAAVGARTNPKPATYAPESSSGGTTNLLSHKHPHKKTMEDLLFESDPSDSVDDSIADDKASNEVTAHSCEENVKWQKSQHLLADKAMGESIVGDDTEEEKGDYGDNSLGRAKLASDEATEKADSGASAIRNGNEEISNNAASKIEAAIGTTLGEEAKKTANHARLSKLANDREENAICQRKMLTGEEEEPLPTKLPTEGVLPQEACTVHEHEETKFPQADNKQEAKDAQKEYEPTQVDNQGTNKLKVRVLNRRLGRHMQMLNLNAAKGQASQQKQPAHADDQEQEDQPQAGNSATKTSHADNEEQSVSRSHTSYSVSDNDDKYVQGQDAQQKTVAAQEDAIENDLTAVKEKGKPKKAKQFPFSSTLAATTTRPPTKRVRQSKQITTGQRKSPPAPAAAKSQAAKDDIGSVVVNEEKTPPQAGNREEAADANEEAQPSRAHYQDSQAQVKHGHLGDQDAAQEDTQSQAVNQEQQAGAGHANSQEQDAQEEGNQDRDAEFQEEHSEAHSNSGNSVTIKDEETDDDDTGNCFFRVVISDRDTNDYVQLLRRRHITFSDLRRELEKQTDLPIPSFRFALSSGGMVLLNRKQEKMWNIWEYDFTKKGNGSDPDPYRVFLKEAT